MDELRLVSTSSQITTLSSELITQLDRLRQTQLCATNWQREQLNFVPLRGSWFAQSEHDFDLEEEITKFFTSDKKVLLLLGDSGAGKSLYTQGLAIKLWQTHDTSRPIPLWISLPALKDPINQVIEETLASYGFAAEQIETLKRNQRFIFILDAYDEIRQLKNLYVTNQLVQWNCQIIITCRREYLYREGTYQLYFKPFLGERPLHAAYNEIVIRPFNPNQIQAYIKQYALQQDAAWKEAQKYEQAIAEIPGLNNLISTPFMLKLTMEVLPRIIEQHQSRAAAERKRLTQAALYDVFIEQWFERQEQKLKAGKQIRDDEDIKPEFWAYAKTLAQLMHAQYITQVAYEEEDINIYGDATDESQWKKFFNPDNKRLKLLQTACLVREVSKNHYAFMHASLLEYFLTRNLYENILLQDVALTRDTPVSAAAVAVAPASEVIEPTTNIISTEPNQAWKQDYFNQRLIVKEQGTLQFLADRIEEQKSFKVLLFARIYASRNNPEMKVAAANAITILNKAKIAFSGMDLSSINIPEADLSYAMLHQVDLSNSDLRNIKFVNAYLDEAALSGSQMAGVIIGQLPFLKYDELIHSIAYSNAGSYLAVVLHSEILVLEQPSNKKYACLLSETEHPISISFTSDDRLLAIINNTNDKIQLWDFKNNSLFKEILCQKNKRFVYGSMFSLCREDIESINFSKYMENAPLDSDIKVFGKHILVFSPNMKYFARPSGGHGAGNTGWHNVELCDSKSFQLVGSVTINEGRKNYTTCINFSCNSALLVAGSVNSTITILTVPSLTRLVKLSCHLSRISTAIFSFDGRLLACAGGNKICLYDVEKMVIKEWLKGHLNDINCLVFSPDRKYLLCSADDMTMRFWNIADDDIKLDVNVDANEERINDLKVVAYNSLSCSLAFTRDNKNILIINPKNGTKINFLEPRCHKDKYTSYREVYGKAHCIVLGVDFLVAYYKDRAEVRSWIDRDRPRDNSIRLFYFQMQLPLNRREEIQFTAEEDTNCIAVIEDGSRYCYPRICVGCLSGEISIYGGEIEKNKIVHQRKFRAHESSVNAIVSFIVSSVLLLLTGGSDKLIKLWGLDTGNVDNIPCAEIKGHTDSVTCLTHSHDQNLLASGGLDKTVRLWNFTEKSFPISTYIISSACILVGHKDEVTQIAFSNTCHTRLASASKDKTIRLWSSKNQQCLQIIDCWNDNILGVYFDLYWDYLIVVTNDAIKIFKHIYNNDVYFFQYFLIRYLNELHFSSSRTNIYNVHGLTNDSLQLLKQHGASEDSLEHSLRFKQYVEKRYLKSFVREKLLCVDAKINNLCLNTEHHTSSATRDMAITATTSLSAPTGYSTFFTLSGAACAATIAAGAYASSNLSSDSPPSSASTTFSIHRVYNR